MLIGYSILYLNDEREMSSHDILSERFVIHNTWEKVLSKAEELLKEQTKYDDYFDAINTYISKNESSKEDCEKIGHAALYTITTGCSITTIYVVPVYDE